MVDTIKMDGNYIQVFVKTSGASRQIPTSVMTASNKKGRLSSEMATIYTDPFLPLRRAECQDYLYKLSKDSAFSPIAAGAYSIPTDKIIQVSNFLEQISLQNELDLQEIEVRYDEIKEANLDALKESLDGENERKIKSVMKKATERYPTMSDIKTRRGLRISIAVSPLAGPIENIELLQEHIEADAVYRYKEAVFMGLESIYRSCGQYVVRLNNGLDVHAKSQNAFLKNLRELKAHNQIRRDGFTDDVIKYIEDMDTTFFDSAIATNNIVLAIYKEARESDMLGVLPNLAKEEARLKKSLGLKYKTFLLDNEALDDESEALPSLKEL